MIPANWRTGGQRSATDPRVVQIIGTGRLYSLDPLDLVGRADDAGSFMQPETCCAYRVPRGETVLIPMQGGALLGEVVL